MNPRVETRLTESTVSTYEALRRRYLGFHSRCDGELGLSVLLRQGMLAWTRVCLPLPNAAHTRPAPLDTARMPLPLRDDIVAVLVTMVTNASKPAHHDGAHA